MNKKTKVLAAVVIIILVVVAACVFGYMSGRQPDDTNEPQQTVEPDVTPDDTTEPDDQTEPDDTPVSMCRMSRAKHLHRSARMWPMIRIRRWWMR